MGVGGSSGQSTCQIAIHPARFGKNTALPRQLHQRQAKINAGILRTQKKIAIRREHVNELSQRGGSHLRVEIEEYIAAEDNVEFAEPAKIIEQVERAEAYHPAKSVGDAPARVLRSEIGGEQAGSEASLHFEICVRPAAR